MLREDNIDIVWGNMQHTLDRLSLTSKRTHDVVEFENYKVKFCPNQLPWEYGLDEHEEAPEQMAALHYLEGAELEVKLNIFLHKLYEL